MLLTIAVIDYNTIVTISSVLYFLWIYKVCCEQIESQKVSLPSASNLHTVYNGQISKMLPLLVYLCGGKTL